MDDIYIYSDTLSKGKLEFLVDRMEVLGHIVEGDRIMMDPHKVDSVSKWKTPGIRIPMAVLSALTGDTAVYSWGFTQARAFEDVKRRESGWSQMDVLQVWLVSSLKGTPGRMERWRRCTLRNSTRPSATTRCQVHLGYRPPWSRAPIHPEGFDRTTGQVDGEDLRL